MRTIHKKRLLNVAKALIDEARWRKKNPPRGPEDMFTMGRYGNPCGSPACAIGTYASRRDLQRAFVLKVDGEFGFDVFDAADLYISHEDGENICTHFGITSADADALFGGEGCGGAQTEHEAAAFIRAFVKRKEREARNA